MKNTSYILTLSLLLIANLANGAEKQIEFNRDIRPILSDKCFYCHGFDEKNRKADLRLDTFEGATADLGGTRSIVPHNAKKSELVYRIYSEDEDEVMPPPETEQHLTDSEKKLLTEWIDQGAKYEEHWAWQALQRPTVPEDGSVSHPIDSFLSQKWQSLEVTPVKEASPREKLRRLSYDLRGLPPTPAEVTAFERDPSETQFLAFRDRWMSSLEFAEHQALRWLDLVRWADTSGFVSDEPIASGAYRAWIIENFQKNQRFDQFTIEQLAGDLLPNPTDDQLIASGYNRIVNTNCEAGAIETEQLYKLKGEHVRALGTVWMGMTTGCAECHDHKFDPLSAKDYYSLGAFFDDLVEAGVYTPGDRREPLHYVHEEAAKSARDQTLRNQINNSLAALENEPVEGLAEWEKATLQLLGDNQSRTEFLWIPGEIPAARVLEGNFGSTLKEGKTVRHTRAKLRQFRRHHAAELMTGYINENSVKTDDAKDAWFVDVWIDPNERPEMIGIQISHGDYGRLGWKTDNYETYYWGDIAKTLTKQHSWSSPKRVKRLGDLPTKSGWVRLRVPLKDRIKPESGQNFEAVGMAWLQVGGNLLWGDSGIDLRTDKATALQLGETAIRKWWDTPKNRQIYQTRAEFVAKSLKVNEENRDAEQKSIIEAAFREWTHPEKLKKVRKLESDLHLLRRDALPVLVSRQAPERKVTRILHRGNYQDTSGEVVSPAIPAFFGALDTGERTATRLDLAKWLFDPNNPLTARVYVNRLWHQFYGRGLSETLEDSGTQGDWPSHLDLLNWLAAEFRDSGWDRNHMIRLLTSTKAYQLSAVPSEFLAENDPANEWHARQSRFRLPAEAIRDSALTAAGLLEKSESIPRQSFFPYQPDPYWKTSDKVMYGSRHLDWNTAEGNRQYQRSLYTFWKRQNIHPMLLAFDAPTRQECTAKRNITNTPGQALALLNDPVFVEAARVLATRIHQDKNLTDTQRIQKAFSLVLQREATDKELGVLESLLETQRSTYREKPDEATRLLAIGLHPESDSNAAPEIAAWTAVTRALLNLHEFVTRS